MARNRTPVPKPDRTDGPFGKWVLRILVAVAVVVIIYVIAQGAQGNIPLF